MGGWNMIRMGASIQELAEEMFQSLLGYQGEGGHVAPRADIAKLKELYNLKGNAYGWGDSQGGDADARRQWEDVTMFSADEREAVKVYHMAQELYPETMTQSVFGTTDPFAISVMILSGQVDSWTNWMAKALGGSARDMEGMQPVYSPEEAKAVMASMLKKQQNASNANAYSDIYGALDSLKRRWPESYKLWPWAVKQLKNRDHNVTPPATRAHFIDVVGEAGKVLNQLRQDNRIPQNFDLNKLDFNGLEEWFMDWKRENMEQSSKGEVVYEFHDGSTIQRLTEPEQLQYEGDEMGHCVSGYGEQVKKGDSIIYSLRDGKGVPHVTMELDGQTVYKPIKPASELSPDEATTYLRGPLQAYKVMNHPDEGSVGEDATDWLHEPVKMHPTHPDLHQGKYHDYSGRNWDPKTFYVVQVMGNGNMTPKPEYQHKIKEFLDHLRDQGVNFERDVGYHEPYDDEGQDSWEGWTVEDEMGVLRNQFHHHPEQFQGKQSDVYGIERQSTEITGPVTAEAVQVGLEEILDHGADAESQAENVYYYLSLGKHDWAAALRAIEQTQEYLDDKREQTLEQANVQGAWQPSYTDEDGEEVPEEQYQKQRDDWEREWLGHEYEDAQRYVNYLWGLVQHHGILDPKELPHNNTPYRLPNRREMQDSQTNYGWQVNEIGQTPLPQKGQAWEVPEKQIVSQLHGPFR